MIKIMDDIFSNDYPELPEFLKISAEDRNAAWEKVKFSDVIIAEPKFYLKSEGVRAAENEGRIKFV